MEHEKETFKSALEKSITIDTKIIPESNIKILKNQIINNMTHGMNSKHTCPHHYFGEDAYPGEIYCRENTCSSCWERNIE